MYPHFCVVVEIKVDVRSLPQTYHRAGEESRHQRSEVEIGGQKSEVRKSDVSIPIDQGGPTKSDEKLLCKRDVPEIRY